MDQCIWGKIPSFVCLQLAQFSESSSFIYYTVKDEAKSHQTGNFAWCSDFVVYSPGLDVAHIMSVLGINILVLWGLCLICPQNIEQPLNVALNSCHGALGKWFPHSCVSRLSILLFVQTHVQKRNSNVSKCLKIYCSRMRSCSFFKNVQNFMNTIYASVYMCWTAWIIFYCSLHKI